MPRSFKGTFPPSLILSTDGLYSTGLHAGDNQLALPASTAWTNVGANGAFFCPLYVPFPIVAKRMVTYNGATATGNVDIGVYEADGTLKVSIGSTAASGTSTLQFFDIADTGLSPGFYFLALACSSASMTFFSAAPSSAGAAVALRALGCCIMASAFALPSSATFATNTATVLPVFGLEITRML